MAVSYKRLFHLLIERDMTTTQLQQQAGFSSNIIPRMKRNGYVSLDTIESICRALDCGVDDILEFLPDNGKDGGSCTTKRDSLCSIKIVAEIASVFSSCNL